MKYDCEVIRDLLPLYHDGVCSGKSREMVEEHLKECGGCQKALAEIRKEISMPNSTMKDAGKAWKNLVRNLWIRKALRVILVAVLVVALSLVGVQIYEWDQERTIWMGADELDIGAYRLADGRAYVEFIGREHRISNLMAGPEADGQTYRFRMGYSKASLNYSPYHSEQWEVLSQDCENVVLIGADEKDVFVIFGKDDELPPATEEIEQKVAERDAWMEEAFSRPGKGKE